MEKVGDAPFFGRVPVECLKLEGDGDDGAEHIGQMGIAAGVYDGGVELAVDIGDKFHLFLTGGKTIGGGAFEGVGVAFQLFELGGRDAERGLEGTKPF